MEKKYFRNCPDCEVEIVYANKTTYTRAEKKQPKCGGCCQRDPVRRRNCPECGIEMFYNTARSLREAIEKQSRCINCYRKKKIYKRSCPCCKTELVYTMFSQYKLAEEEEACCSKKCSYEKIFDEKKSKHEGTIVNNFKIITYFKENNHPRVIVECLTCKGISNREFHRLAHNGCKFCKQLAHDLTNKESMSKFQKSLEHAEIGTIRYRAKTKGLEIELSDEEIVNLMNSPCNYCGISGSNNTRRKSVKHSEYVWKHNGIDRLDSSGGYTKKNSVSCCKTCNYMKRHHPIDEFLSHIERIHKHQQSILSQ